MCCGALPPARSVPGRKSLLTHTMVQSQPPGLPGAFISTLKRRAIEIRHVLRVLEELRWES